MKNSLSISLRLEFIQPQSTKSVLSLNIGWHVPWNCMAGEFFLSFSFAKKKEREKKFHEWNVVYNHYSDLWSKQFSPFGSLRTKSSKRIFIIGVNTSACIMTVDFPKHFIYFRIKLCQHVVFFGKCVEMKIDIFVYSTISGGLHIKSSDINPKWRWTVWK